MTSEGRGMLGVWGRLREFPYRFFHMIRSMLKISIERTRIHELPIAVTLDVDDKGKYIFTPYMFINGQWERIPDIRTVWSYGFVLERHDRRYVVQPETYETLLAIRSMNPTVLDDGTIVSDFLIPQFGYLKMRSEVQQSDRAKEIKISKKAIKAVAKIDYNPQEGMIIRTGYLQKGKGGLVLPSNIRKTPNGPYAKIGKTFYPVLQRGDQDLDTLLTRKKRCIPVDEIPEFFKRDLVLLKTKLNAVLSEEAEKIEILNKAFHPNVNVRSDEPGWLDFKIDYTVGQYVIPHDLIKHGNEKYVRINQYAWAKVDKESIKQIEDYLRELDAQETPEGFRIPIERFTSLEDFIEKIGGLREVSAQYQQFLDSITDFRPVDDFQLPQEIEIHLTNKGINLRHYQRAGIHWLSWLMEHHLHGIIADDMGLGKTIQTAATMSMCYQKKQVKRHSLIICPKSVVRFWANELRRCFPKILIHEYVGTARRRDYLSSPGPIVFISTYNTVARDVDTLQTVPFFFVVLDEATRIKNRETACAQAAKRLNTAHRVALTGTPIENRPAELWSIFDFLMRGHLSSYSGFIRRFEEPLKAGDDEAAKMLSKRIRPFLLRRLKKDVAPELPEKIDMNEWCELTDEQKSLYGQIQEQYVSPIRKSLLMNHRNTANILAALTKLKQVCDHPALITKNLSPVEGRSEKFDRVLEIVDEIRDAGEKVVVFSHFLGTFDLCETAFKERGINYIRIDGRMSIGDRQHSIDAFNHGDVDAALISLKAGGHGITLTAANHVIHVDHWWNPAVEDQATDRVHRIGQDKTVYVYQIITTGTLEERIAQLLEKKRDLADSVIGPLEGKFSGWTREELLDLLKPLDE